MTMRALFVVSVCSLLAACGDDGAVAGDGSTSGTETCTPPATTAPTTMSTSTMTTTSGETMGMDDTSSGGAPDTTGTTGGDSESTTGDTTGDTTGSDTMASTGDTTSGGVADECPSAEVLAAIDQHAHDLVATAGLLAGHPGPSEANGFLLAPGLPSPPAISAVFAGPLIMPCSAPLSYDPYCEEGRCSQIECTGEGAGWIMHFWLQPASMSGDWDFDDVTVDSLWIDGNPGLTFDIATVSTGPDGVDMSMTGNGEMDLGGMTVTETFPALHDAGPTTLEYTDDAAGFSGQLTIADVVVATVDAGGHLVPTGECP
jgi:hypothetical protein